MANLDHTEDILDDLKTFTAANYGTYLAAITSDKADSIPLAAPASDAILTAPIDNADQIRSVPVVFIHAVETEFEPFTSGAELARVTAEIWILTSGYSRDMLIQQIYRYGAAFRNMVRYNYTLGALVDNAAVRRLRYWQEVFGDDEIMAVSIEAEIEKPVPVS